MLDMNFVCVELTLKTKMLEQKKCCVCVCLSVCLLVCITKSKVVLKEIAVRSSRIFQLTSGPLGCAIQQTIFQVQVSLSVDGAKLLIVSTAFLLFQNLFWKIAHIRMTVSKGKKLTAFRKLSGHCEYLLFILWHVECKDFGRTCGSVIWTNNLVLYIH